jgi:hypothetical protein
MAGLAPQTRGLCARLPQNLFNNVVPEICAILIFCSLKININWQDVSRSRILYKEQQRCLAHLSNGLDEIIYGTPGRPKRVYNLFDKLATAVQFPFRYLIWMQ